MRLLLNSAISWVWWGTAPPAPNVETPLSMNITDVTHVTTISTVCVMGASIVGSTKSRWDHNLFKFYENSVCCWGWVSQGIVSNVYSSPSFQRNPSLILIFLSSMSDPAVCLRTCSFDNRKPFNIPRFLKTVGSRMHCIIFLL